jgi:hypothetical protein
VQLDRDPYTFFILQKPKFALYIFGVLYPMGTYVSLNIALQPNSNNDIHKIFAHPQKASSIGFCLLCIIVHNHLQNIRKWLSQLESMASVVLESAPFCSFWSFKNSQFARSTPSCQSIPWKHTLTLIAYTGIVITECK